MNLAEAIDNYPYGKTSSYLITALTMLYAKRVKGNIQYEDYFDFPDYWGLPEDLASKLSPDEVDWIQIVTYDWHKNK